MKPIEIAIPFIGPSLNQYIRMNKYKRNDLTQKWHTIIKLMVTQQSIEIINEIDLPVIVRIFGYFQPGKRRYDCDNLVASVKLILDGIVRAGVLKNDSPKYIRSIELISAQTKEADHILVEIFPAGSSPAF